MAHAPSLPLVPGPHTGEPAHAFFANLLPEGRVRSLVARRLGISESNDFGLLAGTNRVRGATTSEPDDLRRA